MMPRDSHYIVKTYINRSGKKERRKTTGMVGSTNEEAIDTFRQNIAAIEKAHKEGRTWNGMPVNVLHMALFDADAKVLEEWRRQDGGRV